MILTVHAMHLQLLQHRHGESSDEGMRLLTKKRRLKRNRKYLVTVMHPFPMAARLEARNKQNLLVKLNIRG